MPTCAKNPAWIFTGPHQSRRLGRADEALQSCGEVLRRNNAHLQCLGIRGAALHQLGQLESALASLEEAVRLNPAAPDAWLHRGNVLLELDRHGGAVASYHEALRLKPRYSEALSELGVALKEGGQIDEAMACFGEALTHKPDNADARNHRAGALLLKGYLKEGFEDYEARFDRSNAAPKAPSSGLPQWRGQELAGRKIIVWGEQGIGDLIQFCRYLLCLVSAGAEATFLCPNNIHRLLHSLPQPVRLAEALDSDEGFAFQSALMSLPYGFGTSLETVPAPIPYLRPEPSLVAKWAAQVGTGGFRIGLAWQGNKSIDLQRSIPPPCFAPLAAIEGVRLINLMRPGKRGGVGWRVRDRELGR